MNSDQVERVVRIKALGMRTINGPTTSHMIKAAYEKGGLAIARGVDFTGTRPVELADGYRIYHVKSGLCIPAFYPTSVASGTRMIAKLLGIPRWSWNRNEMALHKDPRFNAMRDRVRKIAKSFDGRITF